MKSRKPRPRRINESAARYSTRLPARVQKDLDSTRKILMRHGARRIILYGSFARGDFQASSDLDLCVEGMPDDQYFPAWAEVLMKIPRRVSILDLKGIGGYLKERILSEGRTLYAAN